MVRPILLAGLVAILPTVVQAQGRGMVSGGGHAMSAAPRAMAHVSQPVGGGVRPGPAVRGPVRGGTMRPRTSVPGTRIARTNGERRFDNGSLRSRCRSGSPGLGFDEVHLAAVCGPGGSGGRGFGNQFPFFPFFNGGFFLPDSSASSETAANEDPSDEQAYDQGYQAGAADASERSRRVRAPQPAAEEPSAAPSENEGYVFVRRDGTVFFAVAYTWEDGTLRYITSEGLRRSVAREALDLSATQQFNEQRGLTFRAPA
jgi:hypothetical protein